jgi:hypothetical protein
VRLRKEYNFPSAENIEKQKEPMILVIDLFRGDCSERELLAFSLLASLSSVSIAKSLRAAATGRRWRMAAWGKGIWDRACISSAAGSAPSCCAAVVL